MTLSPRPVESSEESLCSVAENFFQSVILDENLTVEEKAVAYFRFLRILPKEGENFEGYTAKDFLYGGVRLINPAQLKDDGTMAMLKHIPDSPLYSFFPEELQAKVVSLIDHFLCTAEPEKTEPAKMMILRQYREYRSEKSGVWAIELLKKLGYIESPVLQKLVLQKLKVRRHQDFEKTRIQAVTSWVKSAVFNMKKASESPNILFVESTKDDDIVFAERFNRLIREVDYRMGELPALPDTNKIDIAGFNREEERLIQAALIDFLKLFIEKPSPSSSSLPLE